MTDLLFFGGENARNVGALEGKYVLVFSCFLQLTEYI